MVMKIVIGLVIVVVVLAGVVALQPSDFRIVRSATISAPPAVVFSQVNGFHKWEAWSPWAKMDPAAKNTFAGTNTAEFSFKPEGHLTVVTWSMAGKCHFVAKAIGLFVSMERVVGGDFERGLAQMKAVAEAAASRPGGERS